MAGILNTILPFLMETNNLHPRRYGLVLALASLAGLNLGPAQAMQTADTAHPPVAVPAPEQVPPGTADAEPQVRLTVVGRNGTDDPVFDFGDVRVGRKITHIFTVRNDTGRTVFLDRADTSCNCTSAILLAPSPQGQFSVPPGATGQIQVTLDTGRFPAEPTTSLTGSQVEKRVSVFLVGQPVHAAAVLVLRVRPTEGVSFNPPFLDFGNVNEARGAARTVRVLFDAGLYHAGKTRLIASDEVRLQILPSGTDGPEPVSATASVQRVYRITIRPHAALGPLNGVLMVTGTGLNGDHESGPPSPSLCLPYTGQVAGLVAAEPASVVFGVVHHRDAFGKPVKPTDLRIARTRWILLLCPSLAAHRPPLTVAQKTTKPAQSAEIFWRHTAVQVDSAYFHAALVSPAPARPLPAAPAEPAPPLLAATHFRSGTFYWLRVTLLPSAPRTRWLSSRIVLRFHNGEHLNLPLEGEED